MTNSATMCARCLCLKAGILLLATCHSFAQLTLDSSRVDFTLRLETEDGSRILSFRKDADSLVYSSFSYSWFGTEHADKLLSEETQHIRSLWDTAQRHITIKLTSAGVGYPLLYKDVLHAHYTAFKNSPEWQSHVKTNGKKLDYVIIRDIMLEQHVYQALEDLFTDYGYRVTGLGTEKHGFLTREQLDELGGQPGEIIPLPFIVGFSVIKHRSD